ncbi:MAG: 4Fe-4S binding protein, partial [Alphaproteobacteria bacterium]|nr:4Fe-4S binding protein [Alphaproteobacteria bacterium]
DGKCVIDPAKCISCGTCAAICPVGAIAPDMQ